MQPDVIVVGAGLAGMVAALSAQEAGAEVLLVDRSGIGLGTNSAISNGVFTGPSDQYPVEKYISDTVDIGKGLNCEQTVRLVAGEAREAITSLRAYGVALSERAGRYSVSQPQADQIRGVFLVRQLAEAVKRADRIHLLAGFYVTDLLVRDNRAAGIRGFDSTGAERILPASAVVLAAGGGGALYLRNDNQKSTMGQGYALAARAGLTLWDMEFVQFYPFLLDEPRLPRMMVYPSYPEEVRLLNAAGEDVARKHGIENLSEAIRKMRDRLSALVDWECRSGPVYMDYRSVPPDRWDRYPVSLFGKMKFDFKNRPFRIAPGVHYFMGGVRVDTHAETDLKGLYACGELVWGLHGANRRGGNALTECVVFGRIAGRNAAGSTHSPPRSLPAPKAKAAGARNTEDFRKLLRLLREVAWQHAGILRNETGLREGLEKLSEIELRLRGAEPRSVGEKKQKLDLLAATLVLDGILTASLGRKESRGAFNRTDYPDTDDAQWLKNSCLTYQPATRGFTLSHHAVVSANAGRM